MLTDIWECIAHYGFTWSEAWRMWPFNYCRRCRDKGKGQDHCVENPDLDCKFCNALTSDQKSQLFTSSYKIKKEKWESKKTATPRAYIFRHSQSHPCGPGTCASSGGRGWPGHCTVPGLSEPAEKQKKVEKDKASTSKLVKFTEKSEKSSEHRVTKSSTVAIIEEPDQKWLDQFNWLEALLVARTVDKPQEPTFQPVKVATSHTPPTNVVRTKEPFIRSTTPPLLKPTDRPTTDPATIKQQGTSSSQPDRTQKSDQPKHSPSTDTDPPVLKKQSASKSVELTRKNSFSSSDSDSESVSSGRPAVDILLRKGNRQKTRM